MVDRPPLSLWLAVEKHDVETIMDLGEVPLRLASAGKPYFSLQEYKSLALHGVVTTTGLAASKETHVLLELRFTTFGVGYFDTAHRRGGLPQRVARVTYTYDL